jgi:hypothetical protein
VDGSVKTARWTVKLCDLSIAICVNGWVFNCQTTTGGWFC